ncbi:phosphoadenosine phosphosulfate reductase family protein [Kaistia defluvii]|uniref:phosphoadenosine phosphosulfate reductase family protein n=1 Tax=Kaistia defluvii TaxID=410841 RepID=UPI002258B44A|nr:phosphoadenosine phosphosulfate reductase family protein [Kaistia defluvii]MCX5518477.1 phosphoadenosine phosphosulfate reductase family protein [Kaistia defluvii]
MREIIVDSFAGGKHPAPQFRTARRVPTGRNHPQPWEHVVSVSGGKDSTALYLLAIERGMPFTAVFADTGHEHPATYEYIAQLAERAGGPPILTVKADFTEAMARKRAFILAKWPAAGVPIDRVERAAALMRPTGIPFLDLVMVKGRFPGAKSRFCTDELKIAPMWFGVQKPVLEAGRSLISWQGVRAEESLVRRQMLRWQRVNLAPFSLPKREREAAWAFRAYTYRPIHSWLLADVFAMHDRHGIAPNPLYARGAERVGCWPCIFAKKDEIRLIAQIDPSAIDRVEEWESIAGGVSKRGAATFFCATDDPLYHDGGTVTAEQFGIRARVEWSKTTRGGVQYDLMARFEAGASCLEVGQCE